MSTAVVQPPKKRRRWFRFRLRTLIGLITVLALLMGWVAKERRQSHYERQFAERMEKEGDFIELGGPYDSLDLWAMEQRGQDSLTVALRRGNMPQCQGRSVLTKPVRFTML